MSERLFLGVLINATILNLNYRRNRKIDNNIDLGQIAISSQKLIY